MPALLSVSSSTRSALRRWIVCLLAALVPLQGMAALAIATLGPAHVHRTIAADTRGAAIELGDFRRSEVRSAPRPTHVDSVFGHVHAGDAPLRHRHAPGDASVVVVPDGALQGDTDELSISPTLAAFAAMLPGTTAWIAARPSTEAASCALWSPRSHDPEPFERPPRVA